MDGYDWSVPPSWYLLTQGWFLGPVVIFLLTIFVVSVIRSDQRSDQKSNSKARQTPLDILEERFAKGEIDADEYEKRKSILKQ